MQQPLRPPLRLAMFISGGGSNARVLTQRLASHPEVRPALVVSSAANPAMQAFCRAHGPAYAQLPPQGHTDGAAILALLRTHRIDIVALAGYLKLVPAEVIEALPGAILNLHPALLPAYGGKGMYGQHVFEAMLRDEAEAFGITVHLVSEEYDRGPILLQRAGSIEPGWGLPELKAATQALEHQHYAEAIIRLARDMRRGQPPIPPRHQPSRQPRATKRARQAAQ